MTGLLVDGSFQSFRLPLAIISAYFRPRLAISFSALFAKC